MVRPIQCLAQAVLLFTIVGAMAIPGFPQKHCVAHNQLLRVTNSEGKVGFINSTGKLVLSYENLPVGASYVGGFYEGLARVYFNPDSDGNSSPNIPPAKTGYINTSGQWVIEPQFNFGNDFCDGLAYVENDQFRGYINHSGKVVIDLSRDCNEVPLRGVKLGRCPPPNTGDKFVQRYSEGLAAVAEGHWLDAKYGFVDASGRSVIKPQFDVEFGNHSIERLSQFVEGRAVVKVNNLYGVISRSGKFVVKPKYMRVWDFSEGLAYFWTGKKAGYIDRNGKVVIMPAAGWIEGRSFSGGLASVLWIENGGHARYGYIDKRGRVAIKPQFDWAGEFVDGIAPVYQEQRSGYIDKSGHYIWKPGTTWTGKEPDKTSGRNK